MKIKLTIFIILLGLAYLFFQYSNFLNEKDIETDTPTDLYSKTHLNQPQAKSKVTNKHEINLDELVYFDLGLPEPVAIKRNIYVPIQEATKHFNSEIVKDAGWAYSQEHIIYDLVTQEIYPDPDIVVLKDLSVECRETSCKMIFSVIDENQMFRFYKAFHDVSKKHNMKLSIVDTGLDDSVFILFPEILEE